MKRLDHGSDFTVLENQASLLTCSLEGDIDHGPGQVVGPNSLVREQHAKRWVDRFGLRLLPVNSLVRAVFHLRQSNLTESF